MTTNEAAQNAIRSRFKTEVEDILAPSVQVLYDNDPTPPPEGEEWMRFSILPGNSRQTEFGGPTVHRSVGVAVVQIFIPPGQGDQRALELADIIVPKFRSKNTAVDGVTFRTPSVRTIGRSGQYWQVNVNLPYFWRAVQSA